MQADRPHLSVKQIAFDVEKVARIFDRIGALFEIDRIVT